MTTPGFHDGIPEDVYHADRESVSVSGLKLIAKAPALFRHRQANPEHKQAFDIGHAAHTLILGIGAPFRVVAADSWRTKAAREERDAAYAEGHTPLLTGEYAAVEAMADAMSGHGFAMTLLSTGKPEVSAYSPDEPTGLMRRCRFDWLAPSLLVDIKTCADASPDGFAAAAARYGYDQQAAYYTDIARDLGHPAEGFAFVCVEKEPPHVVEVYELDADFVARGRARNRRALERLRDCRESGVWPGYTGQPYTTLTAPRWARYDDMEHAS